MEHLSPAVRQGARKKLRLLEKAVNTAMIGSQGEQEREGTQAEVLGRDGRDLSKW